MQNEFGNIQDTVTSPYSQWVGKKFLIIRFSSIGDIVLTTPVIRCLKKQIPGAKVHFLTKDAFRSVIEDNPYIDKLHVLAHSWELMIHELMEENFDYIIDLHHNVRTMRVKKELGKKSFSFYKLNNIEINREKSFLICINGSEEDCEKGIKMGNTTILPRERNQAVRALGYG